MPRFDDNGNVADDGNGEEIDLFKWQAKRMSNYLWYLLTKELDSTDPDKPNKNTSHNSPPYFGRGQR